MPEPTNEHGELLYISCGSAGCNEYLTKRDVAFGYTPGPHTGWVAIGEGESRRYYCKDHVDEAS